MLEVKRCVILRANSEMYRDMYFDLAENKETFLVIRQIRFDENGVPADSKTIRLSEGEWATMMHELVDQDVRGAANAKPS